MATKGIGKPCLSLLYMLTQGPSRTLLCTSTSNLTHPISPGPWRGNRKQPYWSHTKLYCSSHAGLRTDLHRLADFGVSSQEIVGMLSVISCKRNVLGEPLFQTEYNSSTLGAGQYWMWLSIADTDNFSSGTTFIWNFRLTRFIANLSI